MLDSATATDPAAKPHDAPPPAAPSSWWDSAMDSVGKAAGAVDHAAHSVGNAANSLAERGINAATGAVRHVAGDTAANAVHGAGESVRDTVKQGAGFAYGVGAGATGALGGMVKGTGDMVQGGVRLATDPAYRHQVEHQVARVAHQVAADPVGTVRAAGAGVVHAGDEWLRGAGRAAQEGNLGEYLGHATGSAAVNIGSFFIPGADAAGAANVAGHLGEAANVAGHLGEAANAAGHLGEAGKLASTGEHALQIGGDVAHVGGTTERAAPWVEHAANSSEKAVGAAKRVTDAPRDDIAKGARGPSTNREFDPDKAGGPIEPKSLDEVAITHEKVDQVQAHLDRFGQDPFNDAMIARQRAIADGNLTPTIEDKAFHAHELDEYQRYQNMGFKEGLPENYDAQHELWNNTHTAALEDYKMSEVARDPASGQTRSTLYHPSCDPRLLPEGWTPPTGWPFSK